MDSEGKRAKKAAIKLITESINYTTVFSSQRKAEFRKGSPMWTEHALLEIMHKYKNNLQTTEARKKYLLEMNAAIQEYFIRKGLT